MRVLVIGAIAALLAGCAAPAVTDFQAPDGRHIKSVKCSAHREKCFAAAAASCPAPGTYSVFSSESHAGGALADVLPGPVTWYAMTYACGPSDGVLPDFAFRGQQYTPPTTVVVPSTPRRSTTTNCNRLGDQVNCTTY